MRERAERKRADVLATACAVVAERGADATRFADVTAATGVGVSTLQYYFGTREDMLVAVFRFAAQADFDEVTAQLEKAGVTAQLEKTGVTGHLAKAGPARGDGAERLGGAWERLLVIASHLTGAVGSDVGWRIWVESWRWALRDAELRSEVLGDYTRWHELIAATIADGVRGGEFAAGVAPMDVARQTLALIDGLALPVALGDARVTAEDASALLTDALGRLVGRPS